MVPAALSVWLRTFVLSAMMLLAPGRAAETLQPVADAIADEALAAPPLFAGDDARDRTAALLVAVAFRESSFDPFAVSKTGDHGLMQANRRPDLVGDAAGSVALGLVMLRESFRMCRDPIAFYAEGPRGCESDRARRISRDRIALAKWVHGKVLGGLP